MHSLNQGLCAPKNPGRGEGRGPAAVFQDHGFGNQKTGVFPFLHGKVACERCLHGPSLTWSQAAPQGIINHLNIGQHGKIGTKLETTSRATSKHKIVASLIRPRDPSNARSS